MTNSFSKEDEKLFKKQQDIEKLMENLMTDEMKEMMAELNKLMEEFNKDKLDDLVEKMEMNYDEMEEQLDNNLELLKRFEIEQKMENTIDKLNELAEKQKKLAEESLKKDADKEALAEKQKKQKEEFDKIAEEYKETQEKNKELKDPMSLDDFKKETQEIKEGMKEGEQKASDGKMKKASKQQKQSSEQMDQMAEQMQKMMQEQQEQEEGENMEVLKEILDNLITFSFEQEDVMSKFKSVNRKDPKYVGLVEEQKNLSINFQIIKDSLMALSSRVPQIAEIITKELGEIDKNVKKVTPLMEDRKISQTRITQQFIMTSANNLALLLSEVLQQMQQQMQQQKKQGDKQCKKPGQGKPSMAKMKGQQKSLKKQMQAMLDQMKKGGKKPGQKAGKGMSKKIAKMLAEQEKFQKQMSEIMGKSALSPEAVKALKEINKLTEKNENDLINKNITPNLIKRQELILTRLLEAENSEYQREIDKKRESKEAKDNNFNSPKDFLKYQKINSKFNEILNISNIKMTKFYENKYKNYLLEVNDLQ